MSELSEEEIARAIARCVDEEQFYNAPGFQNAARAVLALLRPALERTRREERERCAVIADECDGDDSAPGNGHWEWSAHETARDIAAAIRKG